MRRTLHRFEVPVDDRPHFLPFPLNAIKHVDTRRAEVVEVWAEVDTADVTSPSSVATVIGTGHPIPERMSHIGTVVVPGGALVWHLYGENR